MNATACFVLTLLFQLHSIVLAGDQSTNYSNERTTNPSNEYNPLEHLILNQNGNKQVGGPLVKREAIGQIANPPRHAQSSTESNIEKIPPNNANNLVTHLPSDVKEKEKDTSSKASVRVKRQYYPYPYPVYRRPYYPTPIIIGGGGFPVRGFGRRGFGGRGFGGRGFGGRGYGGRGFGGRGIGGRGIGGRGGIGGGRGGGRG